MNVCILMGSMREHGNTKALLQPFIEELKSKEVDINEIWIKDRNIETCRSCFACQNIDDVPGCAICDDMNTIYEAILKADCSVLASPIYSWFCTAPMKTLLDRLFCLNKYYGNTVEKYSLWEKKYCALVATCGYEIENGVDLFEEAIKRLANHSKLNYIGKLAVRDINGIIDFETDEVAESAKAFALNIWSTLKNVPDSVTNGAIHIVK